jgi:chromosome segregation protein
MGGVRLVTLDGELVEHSGAMVGGMIPHMTLKFGIPTESEINKIGKKLQKAIEHADKIALQLTDIRTEILELEEKLRKVNVHEDTQAQKRKEFEADRTVILEKLGLFKDEYTKKCEESEGLKAELDKAEKKITELSEEFTRMETERNEKQGIMLKATSREIAEKISESREELISINESLHELDSRQTTLNTHIKLYNEKCEEYRSAINEIDNKLKSNTELISKNKERNVKHGTDLTKLIKVEETMNKDQIKLNNDRDKLKEREIKLGNDLEKLRDKITTINDLIINTRVQIQNINNDLAEVLTELQRYEDFEQPEVEGESKSLEDLKKIIPQYESKLDSLQPVNLRAIEEYDKQNERMEKLNEEVNQLETQRDNLNELVEELKTKKKDGLMEVFNSVNENFKVIFNEISIGGTAELRLDNYKDPFEGGLQIRARPKNKKALRLEALSGGEKSLTALALIFSIQRYQPSPFYVLDEVDMFLDALNAENVGKMITKNSQMAQFILVSLRKVTFKDASHVYGITMQGTGISYIIGNVNLGEIGEDGKIMRDLKDIDRSPPTGGPPEFTGG